MLPVRRFVPLFGALITACALNPRPSTDSRLEAAITEASVRSHMAFLASDALNGRASGSRDEWIAATYVAAEMMRAGLEPMGENGDFVHRVEIHPYESTSAPTMVAGERRYTHGKEILVQFLASARISGPLRKFAPGVASAGAVVLMPDAAAEAMPPAPPGAAAVLTIETARERQRWSLLGARSPAPIARLAGVAARQSRPATVALDRAAYAAMSALPDGAPVTIEASVREAERRATWNVAARLTGSDPSSASEVILLSAHIDHVGARPASGGAAAGDVIYNGADDDASGTVAVVELAKALARGPRPRRTIVFALFGSEEEGGLGSRYFADRPVVPLASIVANLQFEMIGRPDAAVPPRTLWLTGYERSNLGPELAKRGAKLVKDPHPEQNFFTRSDNIQFARRGVIAHTVSSYGLHREYHRPSDEIGLIDFAHMTDAIRSMLGPIRWLADSRFRPEWLPGLGPSD